MGEALLYAFDGGDQVADEVPCAGRFAGGSRFTGFRGPSAWRGSCTLSGTREQSAQRTDDSVRVMRGGAVFLACVTSRRRDISDAGRISFSMNYRF